MLTGSADKRTEDFTVPTNYWRIVYTIKAQNEQYGGFYAYIYPSGETKSYVASVELNKLRPCRPKRFLDPCVSGQPKLVDDRSSNPTVTKSVAEVNSERDFSIPDS